MVNLPTVFSSSDQQILVVRYTNKQTIILIYQQKTAKVIARRQCLYRKLPICFLWMAIVLKFPLSDSPKINLAFFWQALFGILHCLACVKCHACHSLLIFPVSIDSLAMRYKLKLYVTWPSGENPLQPHSWRTCDRSAVVWHVAELDGVRGVCWSSKPLCHGTILSG